MSRTKFLFPIVVMILVIILFHYTNWIWVKLYPVIVNFFLFCLFFGSIFEKETIIQKFARLMEPDIKPKALEYTRNLTYVWAVFIFLNFLVSVATLFMSEKVWAFYNGFLSCILVGAFFIIEYIMRIWFITTILN